MQTLIYWLPFAALASLSFARPSAQRVWLAPIAVLLVVFVGMRHQVGTDWGTYVSWVEEAGQGTLLTAMAETDWAYALLNWSGANGLGGIYFVNAVCAILAIGPLAWFCTTRKNPALALLVAVPYLVTVVSMNYTRQSVAVGFAMLAMLALERRRIGPFLAALTVAALFHKSAVCLFVLAPALFAGEWNRRSLQRLAAIILYAIALSAILMSQEFFPLFRMYFLATGDQIGVVTLAKEAPSGVYSGGAVLRLTQSVIAVGAFVLLTRQLRLPPAQLWLWSIMSACVLCLFALSFVRSTLADRIGLFFIPLQLYAFSSLPSLFARPVALALRGLIIFCLAASFWVWLNFGSDADLWLPYQSVMTLWISR